MQTLLLNLALTHTKSVGPITIQKLLEEFKTAKEIFDLTIEELTARGVSANIARLLKNGDNIARAQETIDICTEKKIKILVKGIDPDYPKLLKECPDAPHVLYQCGDINLNDYRTVSIVGTRKATKEGIENTQRVVRELAESYPDIVIISGLAFGIDRTAHAAALQNNVPTVAFLPGWVLDITPSGHIELARDIVRKGGAIISDMPPGTIISKGNFLSRNRLIAGISSATIVIESPDKGGSTNTATIAVSYGRSVFALPGRSGDVNSYGTNQLIKTSKAILYQDCSDFAAELHWQRKNLKQFSTTDIEALNSVHQEVFASIGMDDMITLDEISLRSNLAIGVTCSALIHLESKGFIKSIPGGLYMRSKF